MSLRNSHPKITRERAAAMVNVLNKSRIHAAILELENVGRPKKNDVPPAGETIQPAGTTSSPPAESTDSDTTRSAA
jgi:hypothetical protein